MVAYTLQLTSVPNPIIALVVAHGTTDLATTHWPPIYAACCLLPLPPHAVTALFVACSFVHFAEDFGRGASLALHVIAGAVWMSLGVQRGLEFMLGYLALLHTPSHYARCWHRRRWRALGIAAAATLVASVSLRHVEVVVVGHVAQRVVVAHICTEYWVAPSDLIKSTFGRNVDATK
mgnify:CR=1 FL=1